jgi:hypothetical protein
VRLPSWILAALLAGGCLVQFEDYPVGEQGSTSGGGTGGAADDSGWPDGSSGSPGRGGASIGGASGQGAGGSAAGAGSPAAGGTAGASGAGATPASGGAAPSGGAPGSGGAPACASGQCVRDPPPGWTPVLVWSGDSTATPPSCASAGLTEAFSGYDTRISPASFPATQCRSCTCSGPTGQCNVDVHLFQDAGCFGTVTATKALSFDGCILASDLKLPFQSARVSKVELVSWRCTPTYTGSNVLPPPSGGTGFRACAAPAVPACTGGTCRSAVAPFGAICVFAAGGDGTCPAPYFTETVVQEWDDNRGCTPCTCTPPSGSCSGGADIWSDSGNPTCGGALHAKLDSSGSCGSGFSDSAVGVIRTAKPVWTAGAGCAKTEPQPTGGVTFLRARTLCCL